MVKMGICKREGSAYGSPLHMTKKSDGTFRPCGDYRLLNAQTEPDRYPVPNIADLTNVLHGATIFSKIDLLKGYFQIPMNPEDASKTAIVTPFGSFVFYYTPFGLRNAGATFQRLMDQNFGDLPFVLVYVDDVLIFSPNPQDHQQHVRQVLNLMEKNGLVARMDKCLFGTDEIDFLGHHVTPQGISPLKTKVSAVQDFPRPTSVKQVQEFTGMINYYHRFVPKAAEILRPLYELTSRKQKDFIWTQTHEDSFIASKGALAKATLLSYPEPSLPLELVTDASDVAVGGVLQQRKEADASPIPIAFFSKKLRPAERKYSTFDRELLAAFLSIRHFKHWLDGSDFTLRTDHRPLVAALVKSTDAWTGRQQRQLSAISEMNCTIEYLPGADNTAADSLSRIELSAVQLGVNYEAMAAAQLSEPEAANSVSPSLKLEQVKFGDSSLLCDVSTGRPRPLVPKEYRRQVFNAIHSPSHPSIRSSVKLVCAKFVWNGIRGDVRSWARTCIACQKAKVTQHCDSGIGHFHEPRRRFGHIHVDLVILKRCQGKRYLFTIVDRSTRWIEAIPLSDATAQDCAWALLNGWVSRFGIPDHVTSDRGKQFVSELWKSLGRLLGIELHHTTSYRPESNGLVERAHRSLKASLMARCAGDDWLSHLPWVLLGLRTMPRENLRVSSAEMVYGDSLVVPGEFFPSDKCSDDLDALRRTVGSFKPFSPTKKNYREPRVPQQLSDAPFVFVRNDMVRAPLVPPYKGPYEVIQRRPKSFLLKLNGRNDWVAIDRLKAAYIDQDSSVFEPHQHVLTRSGRISRPPNRLSVQ